MMESINLAIEFFNGWNFDWVILFSLAFVGIAIIYIHLKNMKKHDAVVSSDENIRTSKLKRKEDKK